jgi:hypothetical protein
MYDIVIIYHIDEKIKPFAIFAVAACRSSPIGPQEQSKREAHNLKVTGSNPVRNLNLWRTAGLPTRASDEYQVRWSIPIGPRRLLPLSLRTLQRNRNELGETTVNKT